MKNNTNLISLAAFITIVGVIVDPLSLLGGVYSWPCGRMAVAAAFLYIGCYIGGKYATKIDRKWRIRLLCAALFCFAQKYCLENIIITPPYDRAYIFNYRIASSIVWILYYLAFSFIGVIIHSPVSLPLNDIADDSPKEAQIVIYPAQSPRERFWKDFVSGVMCFALYMVMSILPLIPAFFTVASKGLILTVRILSLIPWIATLIYVYKCVMSETVSKWISNMPIFTKVVAGMCPGAIFILLINLCHTLIEWWYLEFLVLFALAYVFSVIYRIAVKVLLVLYKALVNGKFVWKEILIGKF